MKSKDLNSRVITEIILLDHLDKSLEYDQKYYCANIIEGTFECSNQLTYVKRDRFGFNYNLYHCVVVKFKLMAQLFKHIFENQTLKNRLKIKLESDTAVT